MSPRGRRKRREGSFIMTNNNKAGKPRQRGEVLESTLQRHKEKLKELETSLMRSIEAYRQSIVGDSSKVGTNNHNKSPKKFSPGNAVLSKLSNLHSNLVEEDEQESVSSNNDSSLLLNWEASEQDYRAICGLISELIALASKIQVTILGQRQQQQQESGNSHNSKKSYYDWLAEQLLLGLIEAQKERTQLVEKALLKRQQTLQAENNNTKGRSLFGWLNIGGVFDTNQQQQQDDTGDNDDKITKVLAHEDPLCGPRLEQFQHVATAMLATLKDESSNNKNYYHKPDSSSPFRQIRKAQRLHHLLQKMNQPDDEAAIRSVIDAYAWVGSYESARAAEKAAAEYHHHALDDSVLQAYFRAARFCPRRKDRHKAAMRAEELFRQQWDKNNNQNNNSSTNSSDDYSFEADKFTQCQELLRCLTAVGPELIPDLCKRADSLVDLCIGRDQLDEVWRNGSLGGLWKVAPAHLTLSVLNSLVFVYAASPSRLHFAKLLLKVLLEDSDLNHHHHDSDVPSYPDIRTCKAVMGSLVRMDDRRNQLQRLRPKQRNKKQNDNDNKHSSSSSSSTAAENLEYGMKLLDLMLARRPSCWPDQPYFHSLFRLLLLSRPRDAGIVAEELLSTMHIRECYSRFGIPIVTSKTYNFVLQAWLASAEQGHPDAAIRASRLVDWMAAQSLPLLTSDDSNSNLAYKTAVKPDRNTYDLVLKICSAIRVDSEKDKAFETALSVYRTMQERGLNPVSGTFSLLFACCENLLPNKSKRTAIQELLAAARKQGSVNEALLEELSSRGDGLDSNGDDDEESAKSGFSLLADLK